MICIKLNTTEDVALKAVEFLKERGYENIGVDSKPTCIVYWNDETFSGHEKHELEPSELAQETLIYESLEDFIEAVNEN